MYDFIEASRGVLVHVVDFLTLSVFIEVRYVVRMVDLGDKGDFFFLILSVCGEYIRFGGQGCVR